MTAGGERTDTPVGVDVEADAGAPAGRIGGLLGEDRAVHRAHGSRSRDGDGGRGEPTEPLQRLEEHALLSRSRWWGSAMCPKSAPPDWSSGSTATSAAAQTCGRRWDEASRTSTVSARQKEAFAVSVRRTRTRSPGIASETNTTRPWCRATNTPPWATPVTSRSRRSAGCIPHASRTRRPAAPRLPGLRGGPCRTLTPGTNPRPCARWRMRVWPRGEGSAQSMAGRGRGTAPGGPDTVVPCACAWPPPHPPASC